MMKSPVTDHCGWLAVVSWSTPQRIVLAVCDPLDRD
jgi:hypothetical protein